MTATTEPLKLAIGLPVYTGQITAFAQRMWLSLGATLASSTRFQYVGTTLIETCGIDVARNRLVASAHQQGADWLLMIDADTWHDDGFDILTMVSDADRAGAAVVAAQVPKRDPDDTHLMVYRYVNGRRTNAILGKQLEPIDAAATAMMAIRLSAVEDFAPPWFMFEWRGHALTPALSEDLYFCKRIRDAGGLILGDGRFVAKHLQRPQVIDH